MNKCVSILLTTTSKTQFWGVIQRAAILTQPYTATNHLKSVLVLNTDWVVELNADKSAAHPVCECPGGERGHVVHQLLNRNGTALWTASSME